MEHTAFNLPIYSPRWGRDDSYSFVLKRESMTIGHGTSESVCTYSEGKDPDWSGRPIDDAFRNDRIYAPAIFKDMLEHAWTSWRKGELSDDAVKSEIESATNWINDISKSKPNTEFWKSYL